MKKLVVAYVDLFENVMKLEIVQVEDNKSWKDALALIMGEGNGPDLDCLDDNLEIAKDEAFDMDFLFDVKEVK